MSNITITNHPLIQHKIAMLRDKNTSTKDFRELVSEIAMLMCYEVTRNLPLRDVDVETPIGIAHEKMLAGKNICFVPVLRAGLGMVDGVLSLVPSARVGHIGLYRDPETLEPVEYYCKLPVDVAEREVVVLDPMLATGNSLIEAIRLYVEKGIPETNICCVCMISSPQGVENVFKEFPAVTVIVAAVDSHLNERGYIVPGMGDAGDRIYNT